MLNSITIEIQLIRERIRKCEARHMTLRNAHMEIRDDYNDYMLTHKYMYVNDRDAFFNAQKEQERESSKLRQTGVGISDVKLKLSKVEMFLKAFELLSEKPMDANIAQKQLDLLTECNSDIDQLNAFYDQHESDYPSYKKTFVEVTKRRSN